MPHVWIALTECTAPCAARWVARPMASPPFCCRYLFQSIPQAEFLAQGWDRPRCGQIQSVVHGSLTRCACACGAVWGVWFGVCACVGCARVWGVRVWGVCVVRCAIRCARMRMRMRVRVRVRVPCLCVWKIGGGGGGVGWGGRGGVNILLPRQRLADIHVCAMGKGGCCEVLAMCRDAKYPAPSSGVFLFHDPSPHAAPGCQSINLAGAVDCGCGVLAGLSTQRTPSTGSLIV
jgi:hypothetical protein